MQNSTGPVMQPGWQQPAEPPVSDSARWLYRVQRFSLVRTHISLFAVGSVLLFSVNLLSASSSIWADNWVSSWALLVIIHAIVAGIATLAIQLLAEDDDIRPASEVSWASVATWVSSVRNPTSAPNPEPPAPSGNTDPWHTPTPEPELNASDRVSWKAASDAAWLAQPANDDETPESESDAGEKPSDTQPSS